LVRGVMNRYGGGFDLGKLHVDMDGDHRLIRALDVVRVSFGAKVPTQCQPENQILLGSENSGRMALLGTAIGDEFLLGRIEELAMKSSREEWLFGSQSTQDPRTKEDSYSQSLCVVRSEHLLWTRTAAYNKNRASEFGSGPLLRGEFHFGANSETYRLPVSDYSWEVRARSKIPGNRFITDLALRQEMGLPADSESYLVLGLDDNFIESGYRYKFISGVIHLPRTSESEKHLLNSSEA